MKFCKTLSALAVITPLVLVLSACNKSANPLTEMNIGKAATFLVEASGYASQTLKLNWGYEAYGDCMDSSRHPKHRCDELYQAMLAYAKTQSWFNSLTTQDLTDKAMWDNLRENFYGIAETDHPGE